MNVLVYLVPMALGLGLIGLFGFLWALRSGQYNDVEGAALRDWLPGGGFAAFRFPCLDFLACLGH